MLSAAAAYFFKARGPGAIHSPFVFDFAKNVLFSRERPPAVIEAARKSLEKDGRLLDYVDYGAGSGGIGPGRVTKTVGQIARRAARRPATGSLLWRIVKHLAPERALELGANLGISAAYIADALPENAGLTTVEGAQPLAHIARNVLKSLGYDHKTDVVCQKFEDFLPARADLAFIDGHHTAAAMRDHYDRIDAPVLVFDDVHWSQDAHNGWNHIVARPEATVTLDLFRFGIVFKNREQAKEHFVLRWR